MATTITEFEGLGPSREVTLPHGTIRYREAGTGEPIVLIHGLLVNGLLWRKVVPALAGEYRCIVPDWPLGSHELPLRAGADMSPPGLARMIADFLAALELRDVTLVGNDSGGALAQLVVTQHPERVGRLVLTPCDAYENFPPAMFRPLLVAPRVPGAIRALTQVLRLRRVQRLPNVFGALTKRPIEPEVLDRWLEPSRSSRAVRRDVAALLRGVDPRQTLAAAERFGDFEKPVLLAWAPEDRFFPFAHAERLARTFPDARLERIEDARTFVSEDQPERTAHLIAAFMRDAGSGQAARGIRAA